MCALTKSLRRYACLNGCSIWTLPYPGAYPRRHADAFAPCRIRRWLVDPHPSDDLFDVPKKTLTFGAVIAQILLLDLVFSIAAGAFHEQREELLSRNARVDLRSGGFRIGFDAAIDTGSTGRECVEVESKLVDRGGDLKLMVAADGGARQREPDPVLVKLIVHAFAARDSLLSGKADSITSDYSPLHRSRLARLSYLAPDIISAIVTGNHPTALNGRRLLRAANLPLDWDGQRQLLGFA